MGDDWLLLETSGPARVGVARGDTILAAAELGGGRRHNRELVPTIQRLLAPFGGVKAIAGIAVGVGPGSYTGLRVGLTAAKTLAYALGRPLVAVPTFATVAADVREPTEHVHVFADALQGTIYVQRFGPRDASGVRAAIDAVRIVPFDDWVNSLVGGAVVSGPGVELYADRLPPGVTRSTAIHPTAEALNRVRRTLAPLSMADLMRLEPLYLRGSSAEEKAARAAPHPVPPPR